MLGAWKGQERVSDVLWSRVMDTWESPKLFCPHLRIFATLKS